MKVETKFYKLLKLAVIDDSALVIVLDKIMPLINKKSKGFTRKNWWRFKEWTYNIHNRTNKR